jgi:MULE transposase domain
LALYGSYVCLLDCTYNTTVYDMPLFTVAVKTNCGFYYVATALLMSESTAYISKALQQIKDANPDWHPKAIICDFSEAEIAAAETVFPGMYIG